jgi:hypothetical protein
LFVSIHKEKATMFQTAVMEERSGRPWGLIAGLLALATLLAGAYLILLT